MKVSTKLISSTPQPQSIRTNQVGVYSSHQMVQPQHQYQLQLRQSMPQQQIVPNPLPTNYSSNQYQQQIYQRFQTPLNFRNQLIVSNASQETQPQTPGTLSSQPISQLQHTPQMNTYASHQIYQNMDQVFSQNYAQSNQNLPQPTQSNNPIPIYSNLQETLPKISNQNLPVSYSNHKLLMSHPDLMPFQQAILSRGVTDQLGINMCKNQHQLTPLDILKILMEDKDAGPALVRLKKLMGTKGITKKSKLALSDTKSNINNKYSFENQEVLKKKESKKGPLHILSGGLI